MDSADALFLDGFARRWRSPSGIRGLRLVLHRTLRFGDVHRGRGACGDPDVTAFSQGTRTDVLGTSTPLRGSAAHRAPRQVPEALCRGTVRPVLPGPSSSTRRPLLEGTSRGRNHSEALLNGAFRELKVRMR